MPLAPHSQIVIATTIADLIREQGTKYEGRGIAIPLGGPANWSLTICNFQEEVRQAERDLCWLIVGDSDVAEQIIVDYDRRQQGLMIDDPTADLNPFESSFAFSDFCTCG